MGTSVFMAPRLAEHTSFVFLSQLLELKGSDASWKHNQEVPDKFRDFSDDEEERMHKRKSDAKRKAEENGARNDENGVGVRGGKASRGGGRAGESNANFRGGQEGPRANPFFYRQERRYNPRNYGPITWNSQHTGFRGQHQQAARQPPPMAPGTFLRPANFHAPSAPWHGGDSNGQTLPNPFLANANFSVPPPAPRQQGSTTFWHLRQPPPPPPPPPGSN